MQCLKFMSTQDSRRHLTVPRQDVLVFRRDWDIRREDRYYLENRERTGSVPKITV